jgi:hypothetical protein
MGDPLAMIDDRIRSLEERLDELRAIRDLISGNDERGKAEAPAGADPEDETEDDRTPTDRRPYPRPLAMWAAAVPKSDAERVAAVRAVMEGRGPLTYVEILKHLDGWRSMDLSKVVTGHPDQFRPLTGSGGKAWELADGPTATVTEVEAPDGLDARCFAIAEVLRDGPLYPSGIHAKLRWRKTIITSTLSQQQKLSRPWFDNTQPGWALTEWGRGQLAG